MNERIDELLEQAAELWCEGVRPDLDEVYSTAENRFLWRAEAAWFKVAEAIKAAGAPE